MEEGHNLRKYVDSKEIAHLWAHQTQERANCSAAMSFDGAKFYSYSTVIAEIVTNKAGAKAYLLAEHGYSRTISGHQNIVADAISSMDRVFEIPGGGSRDKFSDTTRILRAWAADIERKIEEAAEHKRRRPRLLSECRSIADKMVNFGDFFQIGVGTVESYIPRFAMTAEELDRWAADRTEREAAAKAKQEADLKAERVKLRRRYAKQRRAWLAGDQNQTGWGHYFDSADLRIVEDVVETSRGASFPISHARLGLILVESVIASKTPWQSNGHPCRLGHYQIESIDPDGTVHAGCHIVTWKAIERIREQLLAA